MVLLKSNDGKNGFTLLEVLIVLAIWSVLLLLVVPINFSYLEKQQEKHFFETFAFDVLYTQNISTITKNKDHVQLKIEKDRYTIRRGYSEIIVVRSIPSDWNVKTNVFESISFDNKGRIRTPGNFTIETKNSVYRIVFPFGKGRYHIVEQ